MRTMFTFSAPGFSLIFLFHFSFLTVFSQSQYLAQAGGTDTYKPVSLPMQAQQVLRTMHQRISGISSHSYRLLLEERRIGNKMHKGEILVNVQNYPLKIRAEVMKPNEGALVEYDISKTPDEAVITPKKWLPAIKLKRDINGKTLRRGHYSINETSLTYLDGIIRKLEDLFWERGMYHQGVRLEGEVIADGIPCYKVSLLDRTYKIGNYTVREGDDLVKIAQRQLVNPYKIRELNPEIDSYYGVKAGDVIRIPSSYAKKCVIFIDKEEYLPRRLEVLDERGWFERYSFHEIMVKVR